MSDYYTEQLVKKRTDMKDIAIKALLTALTIVSILAIFMFPMAIIAPVIMIAADIIMFRRLDVEYEYIYVNGELDIDKIMHKERRKHLFTANLNEMEVLAKSGASELDAFKNVKTADYTTRQPEAKVYEMVLLIKGEKIKVLFEPNEEMLEGIWMTAPRKVFR